MKNFKRNSISLVLFLMATLALGSCSKASDESGSSTPVNNDIKINSDKKITEIIAAHQITVNVSSKKEFKFIIVGGNDWIIPESNQPTYPKGDSVKIKFNLKENTLGANRDAKIFFSTSNRKDLSNMVTVTQTGIITVKTPGTLAQEIKKQGLDSTMIKKLTVSGTLGGIDVLCLRKMAGKDQNDNMTNGVLTDLDMSKAKFNPDSFIYIYYDKKYKITSPDVFPPYMFTGISILKNIKLPIAIKTIGKGAFFRCSDLVSVSIPENVTSIESYTFLECAVLKDVTMYGLDPSKINVKTDSFDSSTNTTLHVPSEAVSKYKATKQFTDAFGTNIVAI